jgi:hypothetical protein
VKTSIRFFKVGSAYWSRGKASPSVLAAIANGCNSSVEVRNIFYETESFVFSHGLDPELPVAFPESRLSSVDWVSAQSGGCYD